MQLFYKLIFAVAIAAAAVIGYDLFQAELERAGGPARIRFDPATREFTFRKPEVEIRIVFASMFGPGEPVMRVRDVWINRFEEEYSDRLAAQRGWTIKEDEKASFVASTLARAKKALPRLRDRLDKIQSLRQDAQRDAYELKALEARIEDLQAKAENPAIAPAEREQAKAELKAQQDGAETLRTKLIRLRQLTELEIRELATWLAEGQHIFLMPLAPRAKAEETFNALRNLADDLAALTEDASPAEKIRVLPRLVTVERRWQGRWVLSANRPRFLTGREVPDIMTGSKMELLALVQDGYAVPLNVPLPGDTVSPLDGPDTYGDPKRRWRDAFISTMLEEGKYDFLDDPEVQGKIYLPPLTCSTFCIFYNEVSFKKAGISEPPRTWPEFLAVCEKLKAAGITPLTADAEVYSDSWQTWLTWRAVGPEVWEHTIAGVPVDKPVSERRSDPPWTDPRYQEIYAQIRAIRERGYFDTDFRGSTWPAAQRGYAKGSAAMMICGSWLVQELGTYKDVATEDVFKLNCFSFPQWPGGREIDQRAAWASPYGLMVCRQGGETRHAVELVKYLSAKDHGDMVHKNAQISCMVDADFSEALKGIEADFRSAPVVYSRSPDIYARRFGSQMLGPLYRKFFRIDKGESGHESIEQFLQKLHQANVKYLANGGEEGYE